MFLLSHLFRVRMIVLCAAIFSNIIPFTIAHASSDQRAKVASGETQVLARIGKREITVSELRTEMIRLGITEVTVQTEKFAMQSILNRHLLVNAATDAGFHRKPDAVMRVKAARDQALADFFLATASQPPEPTLAEVEDYIANNPGLFAQRKQYTFEVLSLPTSQFDADAMTALFSETADFSDFSAALKAQNIDHSIKPLVQASSSFPSEIRKQLSKYTINDNIVIKADRETQIMKILKAESDLAPSAQWPAIARRIVKEENAVRRARALVDSLKLGNSVIYYREELAPGSTANQENQKPQKATGK